MGTFDPRGAGEADAGCNHRREWRAGLREAHHPIFSIRLWKSPLRRKRIGSKFRVFTLPAAAMAEMGVGQLVGDEPADEAGGAVPERAFEHHRSTGRARSWKTYRDMHHHSCTRLVIAHAKSRIVHQIIANLSGQAFDHRGNMR